MTPTTILAISFAGLAFGILLTWWGRRGKRVDQHPVCRRCKFDLVGRPQQSDRCPECGADLGRKRAITTGNRKPRLSAIIIGVCISIPTACVFSGWGWVRFRYVKEADKPTWLVLMDAKSKDATLRSASLLELYSREKLGQLSESQCNAYIDRLAAVDYSLDESGRSDALDDLSALCPGNQRAMQALVAKLRIPDPQDEDRPWGGFIPSYHGEYAAELLDRLGAPGWNAMREEVRRGSPWVLKHWLRVNGYEHGGLEDEPIAESMVRALDSKDQDLATRAQNVIRFMSSDSIHFASRPALVGLSDPRPETRITCLSLLSHLDKPPPFDVLLPLLHDPNSEVLSHAEDALVGCYSWTSDSRAVPLLIRILDDPEDWRRKEAANALSHYKTPASIHALALLLKDEDLCGDAIDYLHRMGGEKVFEAVIDVLDDVPADLHGRVEELADWVCKGNHKNTPYWQEHEAAKHLH